MDYIFIDKTIKTSIYKQIASSISYAIDSGRLSYNDRLPTEKEICELFEVSQTAVKMAYQKLIEEQKIKRIKGRGTFVTNRPTYHQEFEHLYQFEKEMVDDKNYQVVDMLLDFVDDDYMIHRMLKIDRSTGFYVIHRTILYANHPRVYQKIYLPHIYYPQFKKRYESHIGVLSLIQNLYQYQIAHIQNTFSPINASSAEALVLNILPNEAVYWIRSQIIDDQQRIIGYIVNYFPGEFTAFEVTVHAKQ